MLRLKRHVILGALALLLATAGAIAAPDVPHGTVERLPTGPDWVIHNRCISVPNATKKAAHDVSLQHSWYIGSLLPHALSLVPGWAVLTEVALCNWGEGWLVAPAGWHEQSADLGADGTGVWELVADRGRSRGWMQIYNIPACVGCILASADPFFPAAHQMDAEFHHAKLPEEALSPKPATFTHPNRCTAELTYRSGGLIVRGEVYWNPSAGGARSHRRGSRLLRRGCRLSRSR